MDIELLEQEEQHVLDAGGFSIDVIYEDDTKKHSLLSLTVL